MKNLSIFLLSFVLIFSACSDGQKNTDSTTESSIPAQETQKEETSSPSLQTESVEYDMVFNYIDNDAGDLIELFGKLDDKGMHFKIHSVNPKEQCDNTITGLALEKGGDVEIRETLEGEARPVLQYDYQQDDCAISIYFDEETPDLAWVEQWDCDKYEYNCPFGVAIPLERVP